MKNFRVAKCLTNGVIKEYAIFEDGSEKKEILEDAEYGKYFCVDNELDKREMMGIRLKSFRGRVEDAYNTILAGNGDALKVSPGFIRMEKVVYFIDREIGERVRSHFLDGWKDAAFAYEIRFGNMSYMQLAEDNTLIFGGAKEKKVKYFETEEDAKKYADMLIELAFKHATDFVNSMRDTSNEDKVINWMSKMEDENGKMNVINDMALDMIADDAKSMKFTEPKLDKYWFEIRQCVVL